MVFIAMIAVLVISACTVNTAKKGIVVPDEEYTGITTKVAILPIKSIDAGSRNVNKIMTVRDLDLVFSMHPQYELMGMDHVKDEFKYFAIPDVEDIEPEEMKEIADELGANVLISGSISTSRNDQFAVSMRLFSARTSELAQTSFTVTNNKYLRWQKLDEELMGTLDKFISNEADKIFNFATNFYATGNYPEAERQLNLALGLNPENVNALYYLGATKYKTKDYAAAEGYFNQVLALEENHIQSLRMLNDMYEERGETNKRLAVLEKIATINEDEELWLVVANLYAEQNNNIKAEQALRTALQLEPDYALAKTRLAFLLFDAGRYGDAIEYLEAAYDAYPENDIISRRLAVSYQRSGRMNAAIERYEGLIKSNPNNTQAYLNVVGLYRQMAAEATETRIATEYNNKAINAMNELKKVDANNPMAYLNLASIYLAQNKNSEAEQNANLALSKDPSLYQPYIILATINQSSGTNDYNRFVDLEKRASQAVGREATRLSQERDAAKSSANQKFRRSLEQLNSAKLRAEDSEVISDLNGRISRLNTLIEQTRVF